MRFLYIGLAIGLGLIVKGDAGRLIHVAAFLATIVYAIIDNKITKKLREEEKKRGTGESTWAEGEKDQKTA